MQKKPSLIFIAVIFFLYSASSISESSNPAATKEIYAAAVANTQRSDADRKRDAGRNPAAVLEFFAIEPGMTVLDMFSGGGYYTELLSYIVGENGKVVSHTNSAYAQYVGDEAVNRYANDRLPNVDILMAENNELELPANEFNVVMMILAYHDIYYIDPDNGWPAIDGQNLIAGLFRALKPGGIVAVVDHHAAPGSPRETGNSLHRIDPDIVIEEMLAAGFVLDGKSDILHNTQDDLSLPMSNPAVKGKTDRFVLKFRKPG